MPKVISVHEYKLKPGSDARQFEKAIRRAREEGLLRLPGLIDYHFLKGIRGARSRRYAAIWVYETRDAWESLWGNLEEPTPKQEYPESWKRWEGEVLAPFLDQDPDEIRFTSYEEL